MVSFVLCILADRLGEKKKIKDSMLNYLKNKKAAWGLALTETAVCVIMEIIMAA